MSAVRILAEAEISVECADCGREVVADVRHGVIIVWPCECTIPAATPDEDEVKP